MRNNLKSLIKLKIPSNADEFNKSTFSMSEIEYHLLTDSSNLRKLQLLSIILIFLKILVVITEYGCPLIINEIAVLYEVRRQIIPYQESWITSQLIWLLLYLIISMIAEYCINILFCVQQRRFILLTNIYLSKRLFKKQLSLPISNSGSTFQAMIKELRQIEGATDSFYTLIRVFFELIAGSYYLSYIIGESNPIFTGLKAGVIVSLLALAAASIAQINAWRIQHFQDKRLKLTQDILCGIKSIKYLQWEGLFQKKLFEVRQEEFKGISGVQHVQTFMNFFRRMSSVVLMFVTFYSMTQIPSTQFYTILIFFNKFVYPLNTFPWCFGEWLGSFISFIKIHEYLSQPSVPELCEERQMFQDIDVTYPQPHQQRFAIIDKTIGYLSGKNDQKIDQTTFKLHIPNLNINLGELHMVIGEVGNGKTSLLDFLIGEMNKNYKISQEEFVYVGQTPWIFSGTVRENILFGNPFDQLHYEKCIQAADLIDDINIWPEKDQKQVGQNGTNLSGGQRQRIAICRALYQNAKLYILDDILSALDEHVADMIIQKAILGKLKGKTIILSLSQLQYLKYANSIINIQNRVVQQYTTEKFQQGPVLLEHQYQKQIQLQEQTTKIHHQEIRLEESWENITKNYSFYINSVGVKITLLFLIISLIQQATKGIFELWTHSYIKSIMDGTQPFLIYNDFRLTFLILFIFLGLLTLLRGFLFQYANLKSAFNIFKVLIESLFNAQIQMFDKHTSSFFITRMFNDMDIIDELPLNWFFQVLFDMISLVSLVCYQSIFVIPFCILCLYCCIQHIKICKPYEKDIIGILQKFYGTNHDYNTFLDETQKGIKVIRAAKKQYYYLQIFQRILLERYARILCYDQFGYNYRAWKTILENFMFILVVATQILLMLIKPEFDAVSASLTLTFSFMLFVGGSFSSVIGSWGQILRVNACVDRLNQIIESQSEFTITEKIQKNNFQESISFNKVSLSYDNGKSYALNDITFQVKAGERVAFCGRTGSGKSSIMNLIVKLYPTSSGTIIINGSDISQLSPQTLRSQISVIPQNGFLFQGTLLENLDPTGSQSIETIQKFFMDHDIAPPRIKQSLLEKKEIHIEQSGKNVSSGEKQVINFVQQALRLPGIVCMDEATSNLDTSTNQKVMKALWEILGNKTLVLISHRLENLQKFDRIYIMNEGKIVETGTYDQLQNSSIFNQLRSQM